MRKIIKELQVLRSAPLYSNSQFQNGMLGAVCMVRHVNNGTHVVFSHNACSIAVSKTKLEVYNLEKDKKLISFKVPYKCEDRNEFFQLSTIHDYHGITYDDLMDLHDLCDFMIKRDINERKK